MTVGDVFRMTKEIPAELEKKIIEMPEYRQGVNKVRVRLKNGAVYKNVFIAWGHEIVKVGDSNVIPFDANDIVELENDL